MHRTIALLVGLVFTLGCAARQSQPSTHGAASPDFELNFAGICVADWPGSFQFYTEVLGVRVRSREARWALLGSGWEAYRAGKSRGLVCELFEGAGPPIEPLGDQAQTICLGFQVRDLQSTMAAAAARGVKFATPITVDGDSHRVEFVAPEGIRWIIRSGPVAGANARAGGDLADPEIMLAELRVEDLPGQLAFYQNGLGLRAVKRRASQVILGHASEGPHLILKPGGHRHTVSPKWATDPALAQPVFLSFMTRSVTAAAGRFRQAGLRCLRDVTHHNWGGTDLILADADGNAVQVVEYDTPRSFGERRRTR